MSLTGTLVQFALNAAAVAFPPAAPVLGIIAKLEPYGEAAIPLLREAVTQGPQAYAAAKQASPELFADLAAFASQLKAHVTGDANAQASDHEVVQLAAHYVGVDPPGWAHEATERWWNQASGSNTSG